jgi:hypothetical protein
MKIIIIRMLYIREPGEFENIKNDNLNGSHKK